MGGGELQLSKTGPEDQYLISNPKINFFKKVYMRYTNFSMTPIVEPCYGCTSDLLFDEPGHPHHCSRCQERGRNR